MEPKEKVWAAKEEVHEAAKEFFDCIGVLEGELGEKAFFGVRLLDLWTWHLFHSIAGFLCLKNMETAV